MELKIETTKAGISIVSNGVNLSSLNELLWAMKYLDVLADQLLEEYESRHIDLSKDFTIHITDADFPPLPKFDDDPNLD